MLKIILSQKSKSSLSFFQENNLCNLTLLLKSYWSLPCKPSLTVQAVLLGVGSSKFICLRFLRRCQLKGLKRFLDLAVTCFEVSWSLPSESPLFLKPKTLFVLVASLEKINWPWLYSEGSLNGLKQLLPLQPTQLMELAFSDSLTEELAGCLSDIGLTLSTLFLFFRGPGKR